MCTSPGRGVSGNGAVTDSFPIPALGDVAIIAKLPESGVAGKPFNTASYALLLLMLAQVTGLQAGEFIHSIGDAHLYINHLDQAKLQLTREPRPFPTLRLNPAVTRLEDFVFEDFTVENYDPHPSIKAPISV